MYTVLEYFTDLKDNNYAYSVGSEYPRKGYEPTPERIKELSGNGNVRKRPVIAAVAVEISAADTAEIEGKEEKPKKRGRKKADE